MIALYSYTAQTISFSLNGKPAADCKLSHHPISNAELSRMAGLALLE